MLETILCGMKSGATKPVNYNKVKVLELSKNERKTL
jgi:hypothetical protein